MNGAEIISPCQAQPNLCMLGPLRNTLYDTTHARDSSSNYRPLGEAASVHDRVHTSYQSCLHKRLRHQYRHSSDCCSAAEEGPRIVWAIVAAMPKAQLCFPKRCTTQLASRLRNYHCQTKPMLSVLASQTQLLPHCGMHTHHCRALCYQCGKGYEAVHKFHCLP